MKSLKITKMRPPPLIKWAEQITARRREPFRSSRHLEYLATEIHQLMTNSDQVGLIIEMSVRHGKSWLCSWMLPSYMVTYRPNTNIAICGYGKKFASRWGKSIRDTVKEVGVRSIRPDCRAADFWGVNGTDNIVMSTSVGGPLSGYGYNLMICDDAVKNQKEANSLTHRDSQWEWWSGDCFGRLAVGAKIILIMARRHEDDIIGRQIKAIDESGDSRMWRRVTLPCIARDDIPCPMGRKPGEILWPEGRPLKWVEQQKIELESRGQFHLFESLYQQNPIGDASQRDFDRNWFTPDNFYYDKLPEGEQVTRFLSIDPSRGSKSKSGDYSAFMDCVIKNPAMMYVTPYMKQMYSTNVEQQALTMMAPGHHDAVVLDGMHGQDAVARNIATIAHMRGYKTPVWIYQTKNDKATRIGVNLSPILKVNKLKFLHPRLCQHSAVARSQFVAFPTGHDDAPDAIEQAYQWLEFRRLGAKRLEMQGITFTLMTPSQ